MVGQKNARTFAAQFTVAANGKNHTLQQFVKITYAHVVFGDVDKFQLIRKKTPDQRSAHADERGRRELHALGIDLVIAAQGFINIG